MAGSCDRNSRVGGKSRGTRSQFRLEDLQPFKSVYPLHLTDMMDAGLSTQAGPHSGVTSPIKETRTLAVREYETTLDQLRRENFDLKLKLFLTEKDRNKQYQPNYDSNCDADNTLQVAVNLKLETEKLRNDLTVRDEDLQAALDKIEIYKLELSKKDDALKDALENVEKLALELNEKEQTLLNTEELAKKYELEIEELQSKIEELKAIFKQYPSTEEVLEIKEQLTLLSSTNGYLNKTLDEKVNELEESNSKLTKLEGEKTELERKLHLRNVAIQGCSKRYKEDIGMPSAIRKWVKDAIAAAKDRNETDLLFNIENLKSSLFELMSESSKENISSSSLKESQKQGSSKEKKSKKLQEKFDSLSSRTDSNHEENDISMKDLSSQTDLQWNIIESKMSDKQAHTFGVSDDVEELREEVLMLLLAFEQKEKELSDYIRKLEFSHSEEDNIAVKDTDTLAPDNEDFAAERTDLQRRLAISCSVNNELMKYLKSLEKFMEDLLYQKNLSTSSMENINETSEFFSELSKCLDQSLKLSQVLSDQLSICEGSKIFEPSDITVTQEEFNLNDLKSYEFDPESRLSQTESDILSVTQEGMNKLYHRKDSFKNSLKTGRRRLSFSSEQRAATEADNVVVLKTGNNEDVILVLNSNGDPEDVLIRNSGSFADKFIGSDQFRRRCWDTAMNDPAWNAEKFSIAHYKENLFNFDQIESVKPGSMRYNSWMSSDSDTWSEPDRNVSLQRIGIDIQTSPVTSKSPRRSRFKDRRLSDDSTKNESASSYVKLHSWSKRRRCSDTSKISFVCKKCRKPYTQSEAFAPEDVSITRNQEVQDLHNKNAKQQKELENLQRMLENKENSLESLKTEKHDLQSEIKALNEELKVLKNNNDALSLQNKTFSNKLANEVSAKDELNDIVKDLEKKSADSDAICDELRLELQQTKERLLKLEESCSNHIEELSSFKQLNTKQENEIMVFKQKEFELKKEIKELTSQKNSVLDSLNKEKARRADLESKNSELNVKLKEGYMELEMLKSAEKDFMDLKKTLIGQKQTSEEKLAHSDSLCKNLTDSLHSLKSKYEACESEMELLSSDKRNIQESLLAFKRDLIANLKTLCNLCPETVDLKSKSLENVLMTTKCEDEQINKLLNEITCENLKLKKFSKIISQQFQATDAQNRENKISLEKEQNKFNSLKQEVKCKDSEIEDLKKNVSKLQDSVEESKNTIMKYGYAEDMQKQQLAAALQKLNEKEEQVASLIEENKYWQNKDHLSNSEKSISSELSETVQKLNEKEENIRTLSDENNDLKNSLQALQNKLSTTSEKLAEKKEQIKTLIDKSNHLQDSSTATLEKLANSEKSSSHRLSQLSKELSGKEEQIKELMDKNSHLQNSLNTLKNQVTMLQEQLANSEVSVFSENAPIREQFSLLEKTVEKDQILLDSKNKEINALQERIVSLQDQIAKLLDEKIIRRDSGSQSADSSSEIITESESTDAPITSGEKSSEQNMSSRIPVSSATTKSNQEVPSTFVQKKEHEKCIRKIKSLQSKLEMAEKRIENLEKEKANLRENLQAYVNQTKQASSSQEDLNAKDVEITELVSKLKTKQSFIEDLKSDLYKTHDSLIDKQKEIDKIQQELTKYKENSKPLLENIPSGRMSDVFLESTESSISDLRKTKHELIDSILELQRQFYESKNIPLKHFDKFFNHIESLRNLQVHPTLVKSESVPAVNTFAPSSLDESNKWDRSLKNTKIDLEVDIECLQNFRMFLQRFFTPLMLQSNNKKDEYAQDSFKSEELTKSTIAGLERLRSTVESSRDRLTSTASNISQKLNCVESDLKSIFEDFSHIYPMNETSRIAVPILQKISERLCSLQENFDEVFKFISILKSLEIFENTTTRNIRKQDMSDQESLLSEETITLSRSESLSPVSFDSRFRRSSSQQQEVDMQDHNQSYPKQLEDSRRVSLRPYHRLLSSSQDSVFQRSQYSSPDLGIESDPNHEHSAPERGDKSHAVKILNSKTELSTSDIHKLLQSEIPSIFSLSSSSLTLKDVSKPIAISDTLHAIGILQEYELLKKEVAESLVGIKSVLARTGDGLHHIASYTSPRKKLEYSTFKAIKDTCLNIEVCLQKAHKLIQNFWVAPCPSEEELKMFLQQNEELNSKLKRIYESKKKQEKDFKDVLEKLKQAELIKEQQEQKISKRLVKTKKVLRLAEKKLLETKNLEFPFMSKHSSKLKQ